MANKSIPQEWKATMDFLSVQGHGKKVNIRLRLQERSAHPSIQFDYHHEGKRVRWSPGLVLEAPPKSPARDPIIQAALAIAAKREIELLEGRTGLAMPRAKRDASRKISHLYEDMRAWGEQYYSVAGTLSSFQQSVNRLEDAWGPNPPQMNEVTRDHLLSFRKYLLDKCNTQTHARLLLEKVKVFFRWHIKNGSMDRDPGLGVTIQRDDSEIVYLSFDEVRLIASVTKEQVATWANGAYFTKDKKARGFLTGMNEKAFHNVHKAFLFACYTGLRISDLRSLPSNAFAQGDIAQVRQEKTKSVCQVVLNETTRAIVASMQELNNSPTLFVLPRSQDMTRILRGIGGAANVDGKKMEMRLARRTFASLLVAHDVSIFQASAMLGHSNVSITQKYYAKLDPSKGVEAMKKLPTL